MIAPRKISEKGARERESESGAHFPICICFAPFRADWIARQGVSLIYEGRIRAAPAQDRRA